MFALKSLVASTMLSATLWSASEATAGGCGCRRVYSPPVYYQPVVHVHHHGPHGPGGPGGPGLDDDVDHDHGGPGGGQGIGGPGGQGGRGGNGQGGQNGGGRNGGGQNGQGQNGQGQNGQGQNGQNQNGQNQNGQNQVTQNNQNQNNQNNQNQNNQNQNGQNQNGNNAQAVQVPSGSQVTLTGSYGTDGQVYLNINNVKLPLVVEQWTDSGITLTLPSLQLTQAQSATIDVVAKNGKTDSIAITLNPQAKLVVNNKSQQGNPGGGGTANANSGNVAGVQ
jgi:hypothetical protein